MIPSNKPYLINQMIIDIEIIFNIPILLNEY